MSNERRKEWAYIYNIESLNGSLYYIYQYKHVPIPGTCGNEKKKKKGCRETNIYLYIAAFYMLNDVYIDYICIFIFV